MLEKEVGVSRSNEKAHGLRTYSKDDNLNVGFVRFTEYSCREFLDVFRLELWDDDDNDDDNNITPATVCYSKSRFEGWGRNESSKGRHTRKTLFKVYINL